MNAWRNRGAHALAYVVSIRTTQSPVHSRSTLPASTKSRLPGLALVLLGVGSLAQLVGCSTVAEAINSPSNARAIIQQVILLGTSQLIESQPPASRPSVARDIIEAAQAIEAVANDRQAKLSEFETVAARRLAVTKLTPQQQALLNNVIAAALQIATDRVNSGTLTGAEHLSINTLLNWIITGATPYAISSPS